MMLPLSLFMPPLQAMRIPLPRRLSRAIDTSFTLQEYWTDFDEICGR